MRVLTLVGAWNMHLWFPAWVSLQHYLNTRVFTWVGARNMHLWLPVWVPLQHGMNMRNVEWVGASNMHLWLTVWVPLHHELNMRNWNVLVIFMWYVYCEVDLEYDFFSRVLCNSKRKVLQHLLHMNVEMKHDIILPCIYFILSPALSAFIWSIFLIAWSSKLTMCLASSYVDLLWVFLH